jgi:hypothetical protein
MSDKYILDGHTPVPASLLQWAAWFETAERRVATTDKGEIRVSTVFLGLNHNFGKGAPLLFETMIFGVPNNGYQERCSTWEEAEAMHEKACAIVFGPSSIGATKSWPTTRA